MALLLRPRAARAKPYPHFRRPHSRGHLRDSAGRLGRRQWFPELRLWLWDCLGLRLNWRLDRLVLDGLELCRRWR